MKRNSKLIIFLSLLLLVLVGFALLLIFCLKPKETNSETYTVTFVDWNETVLDIQNIEKGEDATAPFDPIRDGFTFTGWNDSFIDVAENVIITATYSSIDYTISYSLGGGMNNTSNPEMYTIEGDDITLLNPTKAGFIFLGWTYEGQTTPTLSVTIELGSFGNLTFTANWEEDPILGTWFYTGIYSDMDCTELTVPFNGFYFTFNQDETYATGESGSEPNYSGTWEFSYGTYTITNDEGEMQLQFYNEKLIGVLLGETTSYVLLSKEEYWFVTFYDETYNIISYQLKLDGEDSIAATDPEKAGYTFNGWIDNSTDEAAVFTNITENRFFVPSFASITYNITYELVDGTNNPSNPSTYTAEDGDITLLTPTKEGLAFTGWTYEGQTTPVLSVTIVAGSYGDKTYTANWGEIDRTGTYNSIASFGLVGGYLAETTYITTDYLIVLSLGETGYNLVVDLETANLLSSVADIWSVEDNRIICPIEAPTPYAFDILPNGDLSILVDERLYILSKNATTTYIAAAFVDPANDKVYGIKAIPNNSTLGDFVNPVKEGYIYSGLFTDENFETAYDLETVLTDRIVLYIKWTVDRTGTYNAIASYEYDSANGVIVKTEYDGSSTPYLYIVEASQYGANFYTGSTSTSGLWMIQETSIIYSDGTNVYDFIILSNTELSLVIDNVLYIFSKSSSENYVGVLFAIDGTETSENIQLIASGSTATFPDVPSKPGYNFIGWTDGENYVSSETTFTANVVIVPLFQMVPNK